MKILSNQLKAINGSTLHIQNSSYEALIFAMVNLGIKNSMWILYYN